MLAGQAGIVVCEQRRAAAHDARTLKSWRCGWVMSTAGSRDVAVRECARAARPSRTDVAAAGHRPRRRPAPAPTIPGDGGVVDGRDHLARDVGVISPGPCSRRQYFQRASGAAGPVSGRGMGIRLGIARNGTVRCRQSPCTSPARHRSDARRMFPGRTVYPYRRS